MEVSSYSFIDINKDDSEKKEQYHKQAVQNITGSTLNSTYDAQYSVMQESYNFYDGTQDSDTFSFLQETENGDTLPAMWMNLNSIRPKVENLQGELITRGYEFEVIAQNKSMAAKKLDAKMETLAQMNIEEDVRVIEEVSGMPLMRNDLPKTNEEFEERFRNYKDISEVVMYSCLKAVIKRYDLEYHRLAWFRDLCIAGRAFARLKIVNGIPQWERQDPRNVIFDYSATDDNLKDCTFYGVMEYKPLAEVADQYNLTKAEVDQIKEANGVSANMFLANRYNNYNSVNNSSLHYVRGTRDNLKVLVFEAEWQDLMTIKRKKSVDKYGNEHFKKVEKGKKDIVSKRVKCWRKGTLIGGELIKDWGVVENMVRNIDDPDMVRPNWIGVIPNYVNNQSISIVTQVKPLQNLKNICMYQVQLQMVRAGSKGFMYDTAMIPDEWEIEDVLKYLKIAGIGFYSSVKDGVPVPSMSNGMREFDMTLSSSITQYLGIMQTLDSEIEMIMGVPSVRTGNYQTSSVGVTQAQLNQSSLNTSTLFNSLERFTERLLTQMSGLIKLTWAEHKEYYASVIGDVGVNFLEQDIDLDLQDYGVYVDVLPPSLTEESTIREITMAAIQSGSLGLADALDLLLEKDKRTAIDRLKREIKQSEIEKQQREAQMAQALEAQKAEGAQRMQQQMIEAQHMENKLKGERQMQVNTLNARNKSMLQEQNNQQRLRNDLVKQRAQREADSME